MTDVKHHPASVTIVQHPKQIENTKAIEQDVYLFNGLCGIMCSSSVILFI